LARSARCLRSWSKLYTRFNAWCASGKWLKVFAALVIERDLEWVFIDGSDAKAHPPSAGAAGGQDQAIGTRIAAQGAKAVIPRKCHSIKGNTDWDKGLYRYRHLLENAFTRLKQSRAVATRLDKLKRK